MIRPDGYLKVLDFGIAKLLTGGQGDGTTERHWDGETEGQGDKETRRQGEGEIEGLTSHQSHQSYKSHIRI
jgi:hypothetical protein